MAQRYGDPNAGGYSITPLGGPVPSAVDQQQHNLYGTSNANIGAGDQQQQQQLTNLNFFSGTPQSQAAVAAAAAAAAAVGYPATPAALMGPLLGTGADSETEQLKQQKELIYAHPLFPLLTVLFQKCELATCTPREPPNEGDQVDLMNVCSAASFNEDLAEFAKTVQMNKPFYMPNPELDSLMLNAIQVLRFHLLELEKVHELCDNFCNKYVNKIKERTNKDMNCEQSPQPDVKPQQSTMAQQQMSQALMSSPATSSTAALMEQKFQQQQHFGTSTAQYDQKQQLEILQSQQQQQQPCSSMPAQQQLGFLNVTANGCIPQLMGIDGGNGSCLEQFYGTHQQPTMHPKPETMSAGGGKSAKRSHKSKRKHHPFESHPSPDTTARTDSAGGSRSSTAAAPTTTGDEQLQQQLQQGNRHSDNNSCGGGLDGLDEIGGEDGDLSNCGDSMLGDSAGSESEQKPCMDHSENGGSGGGRNGGSGPNGKKKVPKVFSKDAISKFRAWLFNNITHPYPAEEQKKQLAAETGLTILQVNNWFINARRRIVQPMIDSNNRAGRPVSVFKNRRRKNSGGGGSGQSPSPVPEGNSPEFMANGTTANGNGTNGGGLALSTSPEDLANNSGGSNSSTSAHLNGGGQIGGISQPAALLPFSSSIPAATTAMPNPYQAAAAVAAATAIGNPYAGFGGAFPFGGMGGMSAAAAMMPAYGLNSMAAAGGWGAMDLSGAQAAHRGGMDG